jgi:hypothetical protein
MTLSTYPGKGGIGMSRSWCFGNFFVFFFFTGLCKCVTENINWKNGQWVLNLSGSIEESGAKNRKKIGMN